MRVVVTGSSGMVGSALTNRLSDPETEIFRLVRNESKHETDIPWNPETGILDRLQLENMDAVVHLAGENIAGRRWTRSQKDRILNSRVQSTQLLCQSLSSLNNPPSVLVSASAIGFYGHRGETVCGESTSAGTGFLADVCQAWESATQPARQAGIRVIHLRIGIVLSTVSGALAKMLMPFKCGVGGKVGAGEQYWSWVSLNDLIEMILHCIHSDTLIGEVNAVSPQPITNLEFTKTLGRVIHRPTIFPLPSFMARLALGEMADELLLSSTRVIPEKLKQDGYRFLHPTLEGALLDLL
ncbi:MAG: TIGR01777 family oxidoreductase [Planctomycetota bacterium]|nr:TIGR01777 family oxidoreductase [Planctomycetota bacterium]